MKHQHGKGSKRRRENFARVQKNWDAIKWRNPFNRAKEKAQAEKES